MNQDNFRLAAKAVQEVANSLRARNHDCAPRAERLAQYMMNVSGLPGAYPDAASFDPSQEMPVSEMAGKKRFHPQIESFVTEPESGGEMVDNRKQHRATVTFKAPPSINEGDIMNFILNIGNVLDVSVEGFQWQVADQKSKTSK